MVDVLDDILTFYRNRNIAGGMNDKVFATQIRDDQVAEILDVDISVPGRRDKRPGFTLIADDKGSDRVVALQDFSPDGGTQLLLHRAGTNLREFSGSGNWVDVSTTLADDPFADIIQAKNFAFILQGSSGNVFSYDGTTLLDELNTNADPPRSTHGIYAQNRLFLAGDSSNPLFLFFSDALDPQTFDRITNVIKFDEGGGDEIRGVVQFSKNQLIIATNRNLHILDISDANPSNWTRQVIIPNFGCIAFRSIKRVGNDVWFLSQDGQVRSVQRTVQDAIRGADRPLTEQISTFLRDLDKTLINQSVASFFEDAYWIAIPISPNSRNSHAIKIDTLTLGVTIYINHNVLSWAVSDVVASEERLYGGESQADTKVYRFKTGTNDNGAAIKFSETTKRTDHGSPEADKRYEWTEVEAIATSAGDLKVEAQIDGEDFTTIGTMDLAGSAPALPIALPFDLGGDISVRKKFDLTSFGRGRDIQHRFTQDTLDLEVKLLGYTIAAFVENIESED